LRTFVPFWREFPRIVRERGIDPEWFLFMEQDIWFYQPIRDDLPPGPGQIRSHLPLITDYHSLLLDSKELYHPRVWEGGMLFHGPLVHRAVDFGIDFSAHGNWFIRKDKPYWDRLAGGTLRFGLYEHWDTMDEFTLYCALVEGTRVAHCPRAVHLQGPEGLHRCQPELYHWHGAEQLQQLGEEWRRYYCIYGALAVYFIAGNWQGEADWKRMQPDYKEAFKLLMRSAGAWMRPEEYERLGKVVVGSLAHRRQR
jgi:hypothetical protein